jgi:transcriptional regulator of acetoin/glycerol metabolism
LNAREVVQCARRISVEHAGQRVLQKAHLPMPLPAADQPSAVPTSLDALSSQRLSSDHGDERLLAQLLEALRETSGNISLAARKLHISRQRAYRLMAGRSDAWAWRGNG